METRFHPLPSPALGTRRTLVSLHFGSGLKGPKMYLQAGLHANEMPGLLVMNVLRDRLLALEKDHQLCGEVVLVPVANPIGLGQIVVGSHIGRFELGSSENFNRGFPHLADDVIDALSPSVAGDAASRIHTARASLRQTIEARRATETQELRAMRLTLLALAADADVVLDLHCDREAVMHVCTHDDMLANGQALSDRLGAQALFYNRSEPGGAFDDTLAQTWAKLHVALLAPMVPAVPTFVATVELRGRRDVTHAMARQDAQALLDFLAERGMQAEAVLPVAARCCEPTPLAGMEIIKAPEAGVLTFVRELGERLCAGDAVAEVIDPTTGRVTILRSTVAGVLFARDDSRYAYPGMNAAFVAGAEPIRSGACLTA